ncbi:MAG: PEP-CTERM system TPR-repeat protein PrsT [Proteobacteria bacterium]|nr:PEP-CTERM system TPR-repeat protein PrsT [Pseudomonadota bacterium]
MRPPRRPLLAALLLLSVAAFAQDKSAQPYELGLAHLNRGEVAAAVIEFQRAVSDDPNHLPARIALGSARLRGGDAAGAEKELRAALALGAADHAVMTELGNALLAERRYASLLDTVKQPAARDQQRFEVAVMRGRAHFELGHHAAANEEFTRAAELAPERAEPLLGLAMVAAAQGHFDQALARVERALTLAPDSAEAWFRKGEILREQGADEAALAAYDAAVQRDAGALRVRLARAGVNLKLGAREAALADVEFVRRKHPEDVSAAFLRWQIYQHAGDAGSAAALAEVSGKLSQYPDDTIDDEPLLLRIAALVHYANHDLQRADSHLERYIEKRPNDVAMRRLRGEVLLALGDAREAAALLTPLARQEPRKLDILRPLGEAYLASGQYVEAENVFRQILELAPDDGPAVTSTALARIGLGSVEQAQTGLVTALAEQRGGRAARVLLTVLQLKTGASRQALATVEALAAGEPDNAAVQNLLGVARASADDQQGARLAFTRALAASADFEPAAFNLARMELAAGDVDSARTRLESLVARHPRAANALLALADIALADGDRAAAVRWLEKAVTAEPDELEAAAHLVKLELSLGRFDQALGSATRMVEAHPEQALAVETLASVHAARHNSSQARRHYRDAARYAGFDGAQLMRIASAQAALDDIDEARRTLRKARSTTAAPEARNALIRLDIERGDFKRASDAIAALDEDGGDPATALLLGGELELARGDGKAAAKAYRAAQAAAASSAGVMGLADALVADGDLGAAAHELEQWLTRHADDLEATQALALLYLRLQRLPQARKLHEQLLAELPDDALVNANLARLYQLDGDQRARATAKHALQIAPESPLAQGTLGWIMVTEGDAQGGLELLRNALSRDGNPLTRFHLAQALHELGRGAEARTELRKLLKAGQPAELVSDVRRYYDGLPSQ